MKPIMSVKEARKLLGKEASDVTDDKVAELVEQTQELAKIALEVARDKIAREKRDEKQSRDTNKKAFDPNSNA